MSVELYREAINRLKNNRGGVMATVVESSNLSLTGSKLWWDEYSIQKEHFDVLPEVFEEVLVLCRQTWEWKRPQLKKIEVADGFIELFLQPYLPPRFLVIMGGGHISAALSPMAYELDFQVTVIDDRPEFANKERFPHCNVLCSNFSEVFNELQVNLNTYVLIVTRGHKHDLLCLEKALATPARYIGMIGSRRKVNMVKEQLLQKGYSETDWQRVYTPVGLPIGAVTPAEIAVSILAEIIAVKYGKREKLEVTER